MTNTPNNLLHMATRDFEGTFASVVLGPAMAYFSLAGKRYDYITVTSGGKTSEGESIDAFDTAEEAINAWREFAREYDGGKCLYWRIVPEIAQDQNKFELMSPPKKKEKNQTYLKWRVYSRFVVVE